MGRRKKGNIVNGWIVVDKDEDMTSTQVVNRVRRILNARKAGHAGTLDPLATGILPVALGEATKTVPYVQDHLKTYRFTVKWGSATDTDDAEGDVIATSDARPEKDAIDAVLPKFCGFIEQVPPKFSAIKINGERAYDLARDGEDFEIQSREVEIDEIELLDCDADSATFEVVCGKGTYMRALARDIALELGTYGHIVHLRRHEVGAFTEKSAISLDELEKMVQSAAPEEDYLLPVETVLDDIPALALTDEEANRLSNGQPVGLFSKQDKDRLLNAGIDLGGENGVILARTAKRPVAIVQFEKGEIRPVRVLNL